MQTVIIILFLVFLQSCSKDPEVRGYTMFDEMVHSPAYEAFSENELTPDGKSMMMPVKGSIARGKMPHPYTNSEADAEKAEVELSDPYEETPTTLARGEYLYKSFCVVCHGATGEGDGPVVDKNFPAPPRLMSRAIRSYAKSRIYHVITVGFGDMAGHGGQMTIQDRWYLAQFVKKLQEQ